MYKLVLAESRTKSAVAICELYLKQARETNVLRALLSARLFEVIFESLPVALYNTCLNLCQIICFFSESAPVAWEPNQTRPTRHMRL